MLLKEMREFHALELSKQRPKGTLYLTEKLLTQHITTSDCLAGKPAEPTAFSSTRMPSFTKRGADASTRDSEVAVRDPAPKEDLAPASFICRHWTSLEMLLDSYSPSCVFLFSSSLQFLQIKVKMSQLIALLRCRLNSV